MKLEGLEEIVALEVSFAAKSFFLELPSPSCSSVLSQPPSYLNLESDPHAALSPIQPAKILDLI
jgi:hypothetical protein